MRTGVDALEEEGIFEAEEALPKEPIMFDLRHTFSFSVFDQDRREHLDRLRQTGLPEVLTGDDGHEFVVQSAEAYRDLLRRLDAAECTLAVMESREAIARGDSLPLDEAFEEIRRTARQRQT